ncbi:MAG: radical SAM protein [Candidatus Omnitrophica bacterium]|nr:radical SAM protein [Candidatus Omnitrophota bacterium]
MFEKNTLLRALRTMLRIPEALPSYAQIEITNVCNLTCPMCFKHFINVDEKHMDYDVFKNVIDRLKGVHSIVLCGYGEPLCHPKIFDAITYCKTKGFDVDLTSNGLLLNTNEKIERLISSGLDGITFSFESISNINEIAHPNQKALDNVRSLLAAKQFRHRNRPAITLQTLMIKGRERDIVEIIEWGGVQGVDRINVARFEQLNTLLHVERLSIEEEQKIFKEFRHLRKKYKIRIDCLQDQVYTGIKGFLYKHYKYFLGMDTECIRLRDFMYVNVDGDVRPCCALVECAIDSLLEKDLFSIWHSEKYNNFRKHYHAVPWCSRCDFAKLRQIDAKAVS